MTERLPIFDGVSDADIMRLAQEAMYGGEELTTARTLIRREMGYRGLVTALNEDCYDASQDTYVNPDHEDEYWARGEN